MPTLITQGAVTIAPQQVMTITSDQQSNTIVHPILGRANPDVTLRPATLRTGTIEAGFYGPTAEADSAQARALHASGGIFTLSSTERSTMGMSYVVAGRITRELEDTSRDAWILRIDYQEVTP